MPNSPGSKTQNRPQASTVGKGVESSSGGKSTKPIADTEVERELQTMRDNDEVLGLAREHFDTIKAKRNVLDWRFRIAEMYDRDQIYARYNKYTRDIETPKPKRGEIRTELPIISTLVNANVTDLVKDKPEWDVQPDDYSDEALKEAEWNNLLLDFAAFKGNLQEKLEQIARSGIVKSIGILQTEWDNELNRAVFDVVRPEDLYVNPNVDSFDDAPAIIKLVSRDIALIRNDKRYEKTKDLWWDTLKPDIEVTDNDEFKRVLSDDTGSDQSNEVAGARGNVLMAETHLKYYEKGELEPKYRIVTFPVHQPLLLRNDSVEKGKRPKFRAFCTDKRAGEIYGRGKVLPVVSPVKQVCNVISKASRYMEIFVDGTYVVDRGANPEVVQGQAGKIIFKQPGRGLTALNIPPLPPAVYEHVQFLMTNIMDSMGVHETSLGRPPKNIDSARGLENLTHGDQAAKATIKQSFERFLSYVGQDVLEFYAHNATQQQLTQVYNPMGETEKFYARGSETFSGPKKAEEFNSYSDTLLVKPRENVRVVIGSGLGNTPQGRYEVANNLRAQGVIGAKTLAKVAGVPGNLNKIVEEGKKEAEEAEKIRQGQPEPADERNFINTRLTDLTVSERAQQLQKLNIKPDQDPHIIPGTPLFQGAIADAKLHPELQKIQSQQIGNQLANVAGQELSGLNPAIQGGPIDARGEMDAIQEQQLTGENQNANQGF